MTIIEGQDNYILYADASGEVYDGEFLEKGTSIISNLEEISTDKIIVYSEL